MHQNISNIYFLPCSSVDSFSLLAEFLKFLLPAASSFPSSSHHHLFFNNYTPLLDGLFCLRWDTPYFYPLTHSLSCPIYSWALIPQMKCTYLVSSDLHGDENCIFFIIFPRIFHTLSNGMCSDNVLMVPGLESIGCPL